MNAVCPNVIRTNISASAFYDKLEGLGLLAPMQGVVDAFESMLGSNDTSGEIFEVCDSRNDRWHRHWLYLGWSKRWLSDQKGARILGRRKQEGHWSYLRACSSIAQVREWEINAAIWEEKEPQACSGRFDSKLMLPEMVSESKFLYMALTCIPTQYTN